MKLISTLKKNPLFKLLSSVKLAVPLLLTICIVVAIGTLFESRYHADYAKLMVYGTWWFELLMALLWLNIFCAAISRIPYNVNHTGFIITHIGLLLMIAGAFVTSRWGIDGQMTIREGNKSNSVILPELLIQSKTLTTENDDAVQYIRQTQIDRLTRSYSSNKLEKFSRAIGNGLKVAEYIPFAKWIDTYEVSSEPNVGTALEFTIKSPFFKVSDWLHTVDRREISMGPATIRVKTVKDELESIDPRLEIYKNDSNKPIMSVPLSKLKSSKVKVDDCTISLSHFYDQAIVTKSKIVDGGVKGKNPALELILEKNNERKREVSFALFPDFSLHTENPFGFKFRFLAGEPVVEGNLIEFIISPNKEITIRLSKNGKIDLEKEVLLNSPLTTTWMGMQVTVTQVIPQSRRKQKIEKAELIEKAPPPPPAILIIPKDSKENEGYWLLEGDSVQAKLESGPVELYFGPKTLHLPFSLKLKKFTKLDYPGTETPLSFESIVTTEDGKDITISMNEPLKKDGFTLYQASYVLHPGEPPASVFSVNKDPGRPIKYAGGIILGIGIIIFTVMRSKRFKQWRALKAS